MALNPVAAFYARMSAEGATIVVRHRYYGGVNRFLFVVAVSSQAAALQAASAAQEMLGCKDPQHGFLKKRGTWGAWGVYRPLIDVPTENQQKETEAVH